jgi:hypothetical protein
MEDFYDEYDRSMSNDDDEEFYDDEELDDLENLEDSDDFDFIELELKMSENSDIKKNNKDEKIINLIDKILSR